MTTDRTARDLQNPTGVDAPDTTPPPAPANPTTEAQEFIADHLLDPGPETWQDGDDPMDDSVEPHYAARIMQALLGDRQRTEPVADGGDPCNGPTMHGYLMVHRDADGEGRLDWRYRAPVLVAPELLEQMVDERNQLVRLRRRLAAAGCQAEGPRFDAPGWACTPLRDGSAPARDSRIASRECTGVTARWCPVHGDCTCPEVVEAATDCPLHQWSSTHGEAPAKVDELERFAEGAEVAAAGLPGLERSVVEAVAQLARLVAELEQQAHQWAESTYAVNRSDLNHRYMQGVRQCGADLLAILEAERRGPAGEAPTRQSEPLAQRGPTNNVQET